MTEELEFTIAQYADGTLDGDAARAALEARLAGDAEARALLAEYRRLDEVLKRDTPAVPAVRWDALAERISSAVADAEAPAQSYRLFAVRRLVPLAAAAAVVIAAGVAIRFGLRPSGRGEVVIKPPAAVVAEVTGPRAETAESTSVAEVSIGPANAIAQDPSALHYADDVVSRPSRVVIASGYNPDQDTPAPGPF